MENTSQPGFIIGHGVMGEVFPEKCFSDKGLRYWEEIILGVEMDTQVQEDIGEGSTMKVGDGANVHIWEDPWLPKPSTFKERPINNRQFTMVNELINEDGRSWNVEMVRQVFDGDDATLILRIPFSRLG
ncbi:hypothetical protein ACFXTN_027349 [Malus domestica]